MKYNIGDKVRIKSTKWYNEKKDEYGRVETSSNVLVPNMSIFCGKECTICNIIEDASGDEIYYILLEDTSGYIWTNDMFEDEDLEFQCAVAKAVDECLWGVNDEIDVYKETDPTEKLVDDSVEFGKNVMRKKISEYLLKYLPMTPDDKEAFVEEMNKNIL